ncbi:RNA recognition motif domain-containing protein [Polluticoccus soli]|uniref:RNA recognition motif domain-containing protein n=1 Tax=Polluticoccus soli TaxID=3034150 RepID=UPI0023E2347C|nr:RNA-binding protein [Flavipsychrobacter sp. JY13-12]
MKVLVSNLNISATEQDLEILFAVYGGLQSVKIIRGYDSYESRGLAVLEFEHRTSGEAALATLNKTQYMDQRLSVSEIRAPFTFSTQTLITSY